MPERLILAVPAGPEGPEDPRHSTGSKLAAPTHNFLRRGCGLAYDLGGHYYAYVEGQPIEIAEYKGPDIPKFVANARTEADTRLGIVGWDHVLNLPYGQLGQIEILRKLGYGQCDFRLGVREGYGSEDSTLEDVEGLRIATALPILAERIFRQRGIGITIVPMEGHVENAIRHGWADAILDITVSGDTMRRHGLIPAENTLSEPFVAVLIGNRDQLLNVDRLRQVNRVLARADRALRNPSAWINPEINPTPENGSGSDSPPLALKQQSLLQPAG